MGATKDTIKRIYETLPQLNCGLCGFEGCGQFAKAVAEGIASPFGCKQDPWAGYRISEVIGKKVSMYGSNRFVRSSSGQMPESIAHPGSLLAEMNELSKRTKSLMERINHIERMEVNDMPQGDATGPVGRGPGTGRGLGRGGGRGRMGGGSGAGLGGECICPNCGLRVTHQRGAPCYQIRCPKCGSPMTR
jgi:hypothetical protein